LQKSALFPLSFHLLTDDSKCPSSWTSSGDSCVKPFLRPLTSSEAQLTADRRMNELFLQQVCSSEGGILLDCDRPGMVDDVADILKGLYDKGLHETTWLVSRRGGETPRAISRQNGNHYKLYVIEICFLSL
ncbi:hypothetical protein OESDEN_01173, partial [Oesophagostomum dentatum]